MTQGDYYVVAVGRTLVETIYLLSLVRLPIEPEDSARVKRYATGSAAQRDVLALADVGVHATVEYVGSLH